MKIITPPDPAARAATPPERQRSDFFLDSRDLLR
jgi:hypothetical protein